MLFHSWRQSPVKVLMLGLDAAGKTTIEYKLRTDTPELVFGTIGFHVDTWKLDNFEIYSWDLGGQDKIRVLRQPYYRGVKGIVFVVDSNDRERLDQVREELNLLLAQKDLENVALLVLANKQDLQNSLAVNEIAEILELADLSPRPYHIQPTCATLGHGIREGFDWLNGHCCGEPSRPQPPQPQPEIYFPGEYVVRTRVEILAQLLGQDYTIPRFLEIGSCVCVENVETKDGRHYGYISEPTSGWVLLGGRGCGRHLTQNEFVVTCFCMPAGSVNPEIQCYNLAGDELARLQLDESLETIGHFRASLASRVRKSSTCLRIIMPDGSLLPLSGSRQVLIEGFMLSEPDAPLRESHQTTCVVQ